MSDEQVKQALAELSDLVRCNCHEAFRDRGLQDPQCHCDSMDAVRVVIARIEQLEREAILDAKLLADTQALLEKAEVVMREAADRIQQLGRERVAAIAALEESGRKRGETLALLDKAADALKTIAHLADGERVGGIARAVLAEIEGGKRDE